MAREVPGNLERDPGLVAASGGEIDRRARRGQQVEERERGAQRRLAVAARYQDDEFAFRPEGGGDDAALKRFELESDQGREALEALDLNRR